jgi:hypoxanthine-DNA glycosylase
VSGTRLYGLPPLVGPTTRFLVLGSFPGARSLAAREYYGHPQNQFWRILQAIWPSGPHDICVGSYEIRSKWLLERGLGLWDLYASCEREGSLDSAIRNPVVNDIAALAHNGGESFKHARHTAALGLPVYKLPSTSPANASWSFARKLDAWRAVMQAQGMV